jgi:hypothetical protein
MKSMKIIPVAIAILFSSAAYAGTANKTGEMVTGMTKQCFYSYLGNTYTKTIKSHELCPLTIQV